ncbi:hypothetical protein GCM10010472_03160 [Pseudonocardia halophobica]|uniref:Uncharacterized protein n=1 Tax=Pseudonocardia halophobica TaxID=29401 RepID=A0A9W6L1W3_9PSEU|nr:hypothetical protein [Pseudonocardia halophobica]GLL10656.1 hypothetical protein GCM10017577_17960 [Pseudonocardia halophobica]
MAFTAEDLHTTRQDHYFFAAMTPAEFDRYVERTEDILAGLGPEATLAQVWQAPIELNPPF